MIGLVVVMLNALLILSVQGAVDMFLKIEGVPGESDDAKHQDWIEILSYSHGVSQPAGGITSSGGARSAGRADHEDFSFVKALDKATPTLNLYCCNGSHIKEVRLEVYEVGPLPRVLYTVRLFDVIVTRVKMEGEAAETGRPTETVTLNYARISWIYTEYDEQGRSTDHETGWDVTSDREN